MSDLIRAKLLKMHIMHDRDHVGVADCGCIAYDDIQSVYDYCEKLDEEAKQLRIAAPTPTLSLECLDKCTANE